MASTDEPLAVEEKGGNCRWYGLEGSGLIAVGHRKSWMCSGGGGDTAAS